MVTNWQIAIGRTGDGWTAMLAVEPKDSANAHSSTLIARCRDLVDCFCLPLGWRGESPIVDPVESIFNALGAGHNNVFPKIQGC